MPVQTTETGNIYFPDGAKVQVKESGAGSYTDIGALNSAITCTLNYTENQLTTANAGKTQKQIRDMKIDGSFTLINLVPENIERLGGSIFETVQTAGTPTTTISDQVVAAGWSDNTLYDLELLDSGVNIRTSAQPTLTSVTLDAGTPETLVEDTEYVVVANANSSSGWSIQFISANMTTPSPTTYTITIDYGSNTPIANTTLYAGSSTEILAAYALKFTHTDENGKLRELELFAVDANTGGFQFNFKGANEDGVEEMPLTFTGNIDTSLTNGRQLLRWLIEDGAL